MVVELTRVGTKPDEVVPVVGVGEVGLVVPVLGLEVVGVMLVVVMLERR